MKTVGNSFQFEQIKMIHIFPSEQNEAATGRLLLAKINARALADLPLENLIPLTINASHKPIGFTGKFKASIGWLNGLDPGLVRQCVSLIKSEMADIVYIEGSNYGRLAKSIKKKAPNCKVITFFHNVEARFFFGALRANPSLKGIGVLFANFLAERWAVRNSDQIICLCERDARLVRKFYGRAEIDVHALCVDDKDRRFVRATREKTYGLFVGGAFYGNLDGARWLAREVAPRLSCKIVIVGKEFEHYRSELECYRNVTVVGTVDSVASWYEQAQFVVAPIFDGSGMKTKIAEALMYGRPVIGTPEAFVGYEAVTAQAGFTCHDANSFVEAIELIQTGRKVFDESNLRSLYEKFYSPAAKKRMFVSTLENLIGQAHR